MAFLNNHNNAFRNSTSAWGDDNVTVYNIPNRDKFSSGLRTNNMDYNDLEEMITQVSSIEPSNEEDELILNSKLNTLSLEKEKRDSLEEVTRIERDDAFEPRNTVVKEDVIKKVEPIKSSTDDIGLEDLMVEDVEEPLINDNNGMDLDTNTFLLAALIVIVVVKIID
tara:strand:+ start:1594 stop:2094 length:501 start_codon:yes stop_codon:yes gene_type:complete